MKHVILGSLLAISSPIIAEEKAVKVMAYPAESPEWVKLKTAASRYVKAFNDKDAAAVAALFVKNGEILLHEDVKIAGHDAIEQHYSRVFDSSYGAKVALEATSVRFVTPRLVVEEGSVHYITADDEVSTHLYMVILSLQDDGEWRIVQSRNREVTDQVAYDKLSDIEWLIGDWVASTGDNGKFTMKFRWEPSGAWLIGRGRYSSPDTEPVTMTVRIGWNSAVNKIISWTFDSEGGFSKAVWTEGTDKWVMKAHGVNGGGQSTSSTQSIELIDTEAVLWNFTSRVIGDDMQDDRAIKLVKTPPQPFLTPKSK
ncbi:MAG: SgcJ/EcaC family oxidoreductase [Rubritalea sp.]|uniref:YybH family protein n=1 Tax=Rubritalea sp. TaxID=2109375 RepID=UPI003241D62A